MTLVKRSALASILISMGVAANLNMGNPLGPFLFAFGLLGVCGMNAYLYTGKVGLWYKDNKLSTLKVLVFNVLFGYLCGAAIGTLDFQIAELAMTKIVTWNFTPEFLIEAIFCGAIMYIAVFIYQICDSPLGILLGVPVFIFCGFQHSIANAIVLGVAYQIVPIGIEEVGLIAFAALGNAIGAILINELILVKDKYKY